MCVPALFHPSPLTVASRSEYIRGFIPVKRQSQSFDPVSPTVNIHILITCASMFAKTGKRRDLFTDHFLPLFQCM